MRSLIILVLILINVCAFGQQRSPMPSNLIYAQLQKLNTLGNAMYLAAHPDDENTRMISYLTNEKHFNTTYLSLTRGDGGQNLIGTELGAYLGLLRTHELLQARGVDGGKQWFTRANDFGFSKHPDETMRFWNEAEILKDMVGAIRRFRPDVIINRFSTKNIGETHGHHSASALLADKAILLAADPSYKIDGLPFGPWQVTNMFCNTSSFFYKTKEEFDQADKTNLYTVDCGVYFPVLGYSNGEIAAKSRSMHRCQGFGSAYNRGSAIEYLELLNGAAPVSKKAPFDNLNTSWARLKEGKEIQKMMDQIVAKFNFSDPSLSVPGLIEAAKKIRLIKDDFWRDTKSKEIDQIILYCAGFYAEVVSGQQVVCPGDSLKVDLEVINRSTEKIELINIVLNSQKVEKRDTTLESNVGLKASFKILLPVNTPYSTPYWLKGKFAPMMYDVPDRMLVGQPENDPILKANLELRIKGYVINFPMEIQYKTVNPAFGQKYDAIQVVPDVSIDLKRSSVVAKAGQKTLIECKVHSSKGAFKGDIMLDLPSGWRSEPASVPVSFSFKGEVREFSFMIEGSSFEGVDSIGAHAISAGRRFDKGFYEIKYEHVPYRIINISNKVPFSVIKESGTSGRIGYIAGAGDLVYESLKDGGQNIQLINVADFNLSQFKQYRTIVLGIRAFNVLDQSVQLNSLLNQYVEEGGTVVVQYNTSNNLKIKQIGPYPLTLGRTRVTDENAEVKILQPENPIFNHPNKITNDDFKYWVQERGVYFAEKYDDKYTALLSMNDPGEQPATGSLIVAKHGRGTYIYTGLVFYRELPSGIPGAYRLMENILAL